MTNEEHESRLVAIETAGSIVWFLMDGSWMFEHTTLALILAAPTVFLHAMAFRYTPHTVPNLAVTAAILSWVCMNVFWIHADGHGESSSGGAQICFALGIVFLLLGFARSSWRAEAARAVQDRFRRLRLPLRF